MGAAFSRTETSGMSGGTGLYRSGIQSGSAGVPVPRATTVRAETAGSAGLRGPVLADMGRSAPVGKLSVPQNWVTANPVSSPGHGPAPLREASFERHQQPRLTHPRALWAEYRLRGEDREPPVCPSCATGGAPSRCPALSTADNLTRRITGHPPNTVIFGNVGVRCRRPPEVAHRVALARASRPQVTGPCRGQDGDRAASGTANSSHRCSSRSRRVRSIVGQPAIGMDCAPQ